MSRNLNVNDSKQISYSKRVILKNEIINSAICYGVHHVFEIEIDKINILNASIKAMHGAIEKLNQILFNLRNNLL